MLLVCVCVCVGGDLQISCKCERCVPISIPCVLNVITHAHIHVACDLT